MEREKPFNRLIIRKRDIALSAILALSISGAIKQSSASGETPYAPEPYPQNLFSPVQIENIPTPTPYSNSKIETPSPLPSLSEEEIKKQKIQDELTNIVATMSSNPKVFSDKYIQDVKTYYQIYKEVADKYNLDWYLLFIVHENETGASAGTGGFSLDSYYKGAMQRDPNIWTQDFVNNASEGLEGLGDLPQRKKDDWKEIAAGASILSRNINQYIELGKDKAVLNALLLYSADGPAHKRFEIYQKYNEIFSEEVNKSRSRLQH